MARRVQTESEPEEYLVKAYVELAHHQAETDAVVYLRPTSADASIPECKARYS